MPTAKSGSTVRVDRKELLTALQRVGRVIPNNTCKPILQSVRLEASDGSLRLSATDLDISLSTTVHAEGGLPPCLVSAPELTRRLKAGNANVCSIQVDGQQGTVIVNGGRVDHALHTMDLAEFPTIPDRSEGQAIMVDGLEFKNALTTALVGVATEPTRYAINGVLLESDDEGVRLVATDGRRLVVVELEHVDQEFRGKVILPARFATLIAKLIDRKSRDYVRVFVTAYPDGDGERQPTDVVVTGRDWLLKSAELEGHFPVYRDVIPESQSNFVVNREDFVETLTEVAIATTEAARGVRVDLTPDSIRLTARAPELGESSGAVEAAFAGGGDDRIVTEFNPPLLLDALKTLPGDRVVIDIGQNMLDRVANTVRGRPALLYAVDSQAVRWVIMSINTGLEPSRETLGSNFEGEEAAVSSTTASPRTEPPQDADSSAKPVRQRRKITHVWPEIGTRLEGEFRGHTYAALVIAAPKLKSGRAIQVITGPVKGQTFRSMTAAMEAATAHQRRQLGSGKSMKGLPSSGWEFWKAPEAARMSA